MFTWFSLNKKDSSKFLSKEQTVDITKQSINNHEREFLRKYHDKIKCETTKVLEKLNDSISTSALNGEYEINEVIDIREIDNKIRYSFRFTKDELIYNGENIKFMFYKDTRQKIYTSIRNYISLNGFNGTLTYKYPDQKSNLRVKIHWDNRCRRKWRGLINTIIIFSRYHKDYYAVGGKGFMIAKLSFEEKLSRQE